MIFVYGAFAVTVIIGFFIGSSAKLPNIILSAFASSVLFFLVTNFGVWAMYDTYPATLEGLLQCYVAGIPFFQYTLLGDLAFVTLLFTVFAKLPLKQQAIA